MSAISDIEDKLYPVNIALSPRIILQRNQQIIEKYQLNNFLSRREFTRAQEMYQTAIYAIGMTAKTGDYYWVSPCNDNTPDSYLVWQKNRQLFIESVEITLWNEHVDTMWKIIENKIRKQYPSHFSIVIHDSRATEHMQSRYYQELHEKLRDCSITFGAVRFWTEITNKGANNVLLGELYPQNDWTEFSTSHVLQNYSLSPEIIQFDVRASGHRVTFSSEDLHNLTLPALPDLSWPH